MIPTPFRSLRSAALAWLTLAGMPVALHAQDHLKPVSEGDGRIHGAPTIQVSEQDLHPGQVQTINLSPRFHTVLEFPYPVARIDVGDRDVFTASTVGNKVMLKATKVTRTETSMSIILADADLTVVPFLVRADSTQPIVYVVRYSDPVAKHLNQAEARIAARLKAEDDSRVNELAELRLQQRLLMAGGLVQINKTASVGHRGEKFGLTVESAQQFPGNDGRPRLYIRYRVHNQTVAPLNDLYFVLRIDTIKKKWIFFESRSSREVYDVQDVRSATTVPPGSSVYGLLILDAVDLQPNESLSIEAVGFANQRHVKIDRVLVGRH